MTTRDNLMRVATTLTLGFVLASSPASANTLRRSGEFAQSGRFSLEVDYVGARLRAYATDLTPQSETFLRVAFWIRIAEDFEMGPRDKHIFLRAQRSLAPKGVLLGLLERDPASEHLSLRVRTRANHGWKLVGRLVLERGQWIKVILEWKASDPGLSNGSMAVYKGSGGDPLASRNHLNNDLASIDSIQIGAVKGADVGTKGAIYLDGFETRNAP